MAEYGIIIIVNSHHVFRPFGGMCVQFCVKICATQILSFYFCYSTQNNVDLKHKIIKYILSIDKLYLFYIVTELLGKCV